MSRRSAPLLRLQVAAARYRFRESLFLFPTLVVPDSTCRGAPDRRPDG